MMRFMLLFSRQGKLRLQKWYTATAERDKKKMVRELMQIVLARKPKMCSFLEWRDLKIVYKRYASLYFCCAIEEQDNELITLEVIHRFVELLDKYFGSVCELDIIFNFEKAYFILDEFLMGGEIQDTSKKSVLKAIEQADLLQEVTSFHFQELSSSPSKFGKEELCPVLEGPQTEVCWSSLCLGRRTNPRAAFWRRWAWRRAVATATGRRAECLELSMLGLVPLALGSPVPPFVVGEDAQAADPQPFVVFE
uniref:Adaptor related protein complex 1 subunit sigma 1 n=1 Tax=Oryzias melastigma TaxID=30732 RepID=A0A3B3BAT4_ORYME